MPRSLVSATTLLLVLGACGGRAGDDAPAAAPPRDPNTPLAVASTGLATPESVVWDSTRNVWYVSNINGRETAVDDNGYIVRLGPDGQKLDSLPFIAGADDDIALNAPKGLALQGDTLWVADIDALRGFSVVTGTMVATVSLASLGATFLNDVAVGSEGEVYITDSGIAIAADGSVTHAGASRIFVVRNRAGSQAVVLPKQSAVNGITWDRTRNAWLIVCFNSPNVYSWVRSAKEATVLGTGPGGGDGIEMLADGRAIYTSWADSSLTFFSGGISTTMRKGLNAPADLGYDRVRGIVAVPLFNDNRVEFWPVDTAKPPTGN